MGSIRATRAENGTFDVEVGEGANTTSHTVTVPPRLLEALGRTPGDDTILVQQSFEFLLEREPATSILPRFSLEVIGDYFPEYLEEMRRRAP